jgi:hypothetical protein
VERFGEIRIPRLGKYPTGNQSVAAASEMQENPSVEKQDPLRAVMAGEDPPTATAGLHTYDSTRLAGSDLRQDGASQQAPFE